ncbi:hypothetical protein [Pseudophaeobacter sp. EL27]|uniref:hypothetical protein n=1 Tax=Pseudophaeobacter sp. EL27 TaxID=2107580 RepID=UPI000EFBA132|nr:hypothetical protein [Pseudophaeobacter sp. EL27]
MKRLFKLTAAATALLVMQACIPTSVKLTNADGHDMLVMYYPGGTSLLDLVMINGTYYFGKAQYQLDDPLADIGFRFESGERVRAECIRVGQDIIGQDRCTLYKVFRSDFRLFPEGTLIPSPGL